MSTRSRRKARFESLDTVTHVDLSKYLGTWYEIVRLKNRFEKCREGEYGGERKCVRTANRMLSF